ncbi:MAG: MASE1 domain-containing protein [Cyclobacteriaceae bacterium]|nr:MASE1 domain-containing protein [Cyclobacteriaceae bacterium]
MKHIRNIIKSTDVRIIVVTLFYFVAAQVGLWLSFPESKLVALWPPSGIALALLLLTGYKSWPAITIGSILVNILVFLHFGIAFSSNVVSSLIITSVGNTIEALVGYFLILKFIKSKNPFLRTIDVFTYLGITLLICFIGSGIGSFGLLTNSIIDKTIFTQVLSTGWMSNVVSILIVTPFIISWTQEFKTNWNLLRVVEWVVFGGCLALIVVVLAFNPNSTTFERALPFIIVPFLLWLSFRFNLQTTATGILIVSFIAVFFTINQTSPFVLGNERDSMLLLQVFLAIISISTIILYATVYERKQAQQAIEGFNANLEAKVIERTKELKKEIETRKKTEDKINISNKKLKKVNVELDNFVYSVSHDLRAPIASVLGLVNLAENESDIEMMRKYLIMIGKSATQQDNFIQDILDLSRNERLEINQEEIKFEPLINDIFNQLKYSSTELNIIKEIEIDQNNAFFSDQKRLKVILNNLLSNAIRYGNHKNPQIKIDIKVDDTIAKIIIDDNGNGISEEHVNNVFKMFYRATEDNAGSGLGLYIVKETVEKLRGNVALSSIINKGTKVSLEIPNLSLN